jgi:hypothetical protein
MAGTTKDTQVVFEEVQARAAKATSDFFKVASLLVLIALVINIVLQKGRANDFTYLLITIFPVLFILNLLLPFKLTMQIRTDGIYVRFPPLQPSFRKFYWSEISQVYIRSYDAVSEYYGWGIKISPAGTGYIVAGNVGIQIIFKNGNKVLITTQRPDEVNEILRRIGRV